MTWFDASAWTGLWPFTMTAEVSLDHLVATLETAGIAGAAVSPLNAVLGPEPQSANRRLLAAIDRGTRIPVHPVPLIDPSLPGWERDLDEMLAGTRVRAVKIVPNYHGYQVDGEEALALARRAAAAGIGICVQVRILDERAHHPLMMVPGVPADGIARLAGLVPGGRFLACGIFRAELPLVADSANVSVELSSIESADTLQTAIDALGEDRLLLGTHAPVYDLAPGVAKVAAWPGDPDITAKVGHMNARRFFRL